jgi:hypothetical protein
MAKKTISCAATVAISWADLSTPKSISNQAAITS